MSCQAEYDHDDWEPIDVQVGPRTGTIFHVRLQGDELSRLDEMLIERDPDMLMSDFLRALTIESLARWESEREQAGAVTAAD